MAIRLKCGREVFAEHYFRTYTYGGMIAGRPTPQISRRILETIADRVVPMWGSRPTHVIPSVREILPPVMHFTKLISNPLKNAHSDDSQYFFGSELVVIWFADEQIEQPLIRVIESGVAGVDWEKHAKNYEL